MAVKKIDAGKLKRKIVLKQPASVRNSEGGKETTYTAMPAIKASIDKPSQQRAMEVAPVLLHTDIIHFRYADDRKDITEHWLVNYDGLDHVVHSVEVLGENEFIKLIVKANG